MSDPYEEIVNGERMLRFPPRPRHEEILNRLRQRVGGCLASLATARMLNMRDVVEVAASTILRPDLALVAAANNKLWLVAEVISSDDHHADTVEKKAIYEEMRRLDAVTSRTSARPSRWTLPAMPMLPERLIRRTFPP